MARLRNPERAADATSATFARALKALPDFRPERRGEATSFRAWLMTIARHVVISELRQDRPTRPLDDPAVTARLVDEQPSPEERAVGRHEQVRVLAALTQLSPTQRRIVELRSKADAACSAVSNSRTTTSIERGWVISMCGWPPKTDTWDGSGRSIWSGTRDPRYHRPANRALSSEYGAGSLHLCSANCPRRENAAHQMKIRVATPKPVGQTTVYGSVPDSISEPRCLCLLSRSP